MTVRYLFIVLLLLLFSRGVPCDEDDDETHHRKERNYYIESVDASNALQSTTSAAQSKGPKVKLGESIPSSGTDAKNNVGAVSYGISSTGAPAPEALPLRVKQPSGTLSRSQVLAETGKAKTKGWQGDSSRHAFHQFLHESPKKDRIKPVAVSTTAKTLTVKTTQEVLPAVVLVPSKNFDSTPASATPITTIVKPHGTTVSFVTSSSSSAKPSVVQASSTVKSSLVPTVTTAQPPVTISTAKPFVTSSTFKPFATSSKAKPSVTTTAKSFVTSSTFKPFAVSSTVKTSVASSTVKPIATSSTIQPVITSSAVSSTANPTVPISTVKPFVTSSTAKPFVASSTVKPHGKRSTVKSLATSSTVKSFGTSTTAIPFATSSTIRPFVTSSTAKPLVTSSTLKPSIKSSTFASTTTLQQPSVSLPTPLPVIAIPTVTKPATTIGQGPIRPSKGTRRRQKPKRRQRLGVSTASTVAAITTVTPVTEIAYTVPPRRVPKTQSVTVHVPSVHVTTPGHPGTPSTPYAVRITTGPTLTSTTQAPTQQKQVSNELLSSSSTTKPIVHSTVSSQAPQIISTTNGHSKSSGANVLQQVQVTTARPSPAVEAIAKQWKGDSSHHAFHQFHFEKPRQKSSTPGPFPEARTVASVLAQFDFTRNSATSTSTPLRVTTNTPAKTVIQTQSPKPKQSVVTTTPAIRIFVPTPLRVTTTPPAVQVKTVSPTHAPPTSHRFSFPTYAPAAQKIPTWSSVQTHVTTPLTIPSPVTTISPATVAHTTAIPVIRVTTPAPVTIPVTVPTSSPSPIHIITTYSPHTASSVASKHQSATPPPKIVQPSLPALPTPQALRAPAKSTSHRQKGWSGDASKHAFHQFHFETLKRRPMIGMKIAKQDGTSFMQSLVLEQVNFGSRTKVPTPGPPPPPPPPPVIKPPPILVVPEMQPPPRFIQMAPPPPPPSIPFHPVPHLPRPSLPSLPPPPTRPPPPPPTKSLPPPPPTRPPPKAPPITVSIPVPLPPLAPPPPPTRPPPKQPLLPSPQAPPITVSVPAPSPPPPPPPPTRPPPKQTFLSFPQAPPITKPLPTKPQVATLAPVPLPPLPPQSRPPPSRPLPSPQPAPKRPSLPVKFPPTPDHPIKSSEWGRDPSFHAFHQFHYEKPQRTTVPVQTSVAVLSQVHGPPQPTKQAPIVKPPAPKSASPPPPSPVYHYQITYFPTPSPTPVSPPIVVPSPAPQAPPVPPKPVIQATQAPPPVVQATPAPPVIQHTTSKPILQTFHTTGILPVFVVAKPRPPPAPVTLPPKPIVAKPAPVPVKQPATTEWSGGSSAHHAFHQFHYQPLKRKPLGPVPAPAPQQSTSAPVSPAKHIPMQQSLSGYQIITAVLSSVQQPAAKAQAPAAKPAATTSTALQPARSPSRIFVAVPVYGVVPYKPSVAPAPPTTQKSILAPKPTAAPSRPSYHKGYTHSYFHSTLQAFPVIQVPQQSFRTYPSVTAAPADLEKEEKEKEDGEEKEKEKEEEEEEEEEDEGDEEKDEEGKEKGKESNNGNEDEEEENEENTGGEEHEPKGEKEPVRQAPAARPLFIPTFHPNPNHPNYREKGYRSGPNYHLLAMQYPQFAFFQGQQIRPVPMAGPNIQHTAFNSRVKSTVVEPVRRPLPAPNYPNTGGRYNTKSEGQYEWRGDSSEHGYRQFNFESRKHIGDILQQDGSRAY